MSYQSNWVTRRRKAGKRATVELYRDAHPPACWRQTMVAAFTAAGERRCQASFRRTSGWSRSRTTAANYLPRSCVLTSLGRCAPALSRVGQARRMQIPQAFSEYAPRA
jgi:hypothetical protein